jgi:hypothetical protein
MSRTAPILSRIAWRNWHEEKEEAVPLIAHHFEIVLAARGIAA